MTQQQVETFKTLKLFLVKKRQENKSFTLFEVIDYVRSRTGTTRIAPCRDVKDYLNDLKENGYIIEISPMEYKFVDG